MDNKRAIEVLQRLGGGVGPAYTAIDREDAIDLACAALTPRTQEWWDTYHAALSGLCALGGDDAYTVEGAHKRAVAQANAARGPLGEP